MLSDMDVEIDRAIRGSLREHYPELGFRRKQALPVKATASTGSCTRSNGAAT